VLVKCVSSLLEKHCVQSTAYKLCCELFSPLHSLVIVNEFDECVMSNYSNPSFCSVYCTVSFVRQTVCRPKIGIMFMNVLISGSSGCQFSVKKPRGPIYSIWFLYSVVIEKRDQMFIRVENERFDSLSSNYFHSFLLIYKHMTSIICKL